MGKLFDILLKGETPPIVNIVILQLIMMLFMYGASREHVVEEAARYELLESKFTSIVAEQKVVVKDYITKHEQNYTKYRENQKLLDKEQSLILQNLKELVIRIDAQGSRKWNQSPK